MAKLPPHAHFILTGEITPGFDAKKAKELAERFLSSEWKNHSAKKKARKPYFKIPLPPHEERLSGGKLTKNDTKAIKEQVRFAASFFAPHLSLTKRRLLLQRLEEAFSPVSQSIHHNLVSTLTGNERTKEEEYLKMREMGKEIYMLIREHGNIGGGVINERTGQINLARDFSKSQYFATTPLHEAIHRMQQLGVIEIDVPFAEAIDTFYSLQNNIAVVEKTRNPTQKEFNWIPKVKERVKGISNYDEPIEAYEIGKRIGYWAHFSLGKERGIQYLYLRAMAFSHTKALSIVNAGTFDRALRELKK